MYQYTDFDRQFVRNRAAQYRDQLERNLAGTLSDDDFRPLRLQNGWYIQRYAPMLRIAVPYGEISSAQLRVLATIAREYDQPTAEIFEDAQEKQDALGPVALPPSYGGGSVRSHLKVGYGHFTTRQNVQFNWIPLVKSADVMELLASVDMHGIQTSGNCIRNITSDERAGIAVDEIADPRPYCEIMRQWSTLHPEFAFLPRKFKIAVSGAAEDRAATVWHDVGLHLVKSGVGRAGLSRAGRRRHGPHAGHRHRDPRVPALGPDPQLPRSRGARLQPLGPPRQHVQGAHQDPGEGRGPALHRRGGSRVQADRRSGRRAPHHHAGRARPRGCLVRAARPAPAPARAPKPRCTRPWPCRSIRNTTAGCSRTWPSTATPSCAP